MGRIEFPSTPITAKGQREVAPVEQQSGFIQSTLEGLELEQSPEIELGNCIVTTAVKYRKLVRGNEWHCTIQAVPDLLHPEQEGIFAAHAYQSNADMAKAARLRRGDRAMLRGTLQPQTIELENGQTTIINHFYVTSLEIVPAPSVPVSRHMKKSKRNKAQQQLAEEVEGLSEDILGGSEKNTTLTVWYTRRAKRYARSGVS